MWPRAFGDQLVLAALRATQAREAVGEDAAREGALELAGHEAGQAGAVLLVRAHQEGREVLAQHLVQRAALGARALVNAAGPWVETVRARIDPKPAGFAVDFVAGSHLELEGALEHGIYYVEAPGDHRAVFAIPWKGRTMLGTTETRYAGDPARVVPLASEVEYLLETYAHYFPRRSTKVLASWSGLRVLLLPRLPKRARIARTDELPLAPEPGFTLDAPAG